MSLEFSLRTISSRKATWLTRKSVPEQVATSFSSGTGERVMAGGRTRKQFSRKSTWLLPRVPCKLIICHLNSKRSKTVHWDNLGGELATVGSLLVQLFYFKTFGLFTKTGMNRMWEWTLNYSKPIVNRSCLYLQLRTLGCERLRQNNPPIHFGRAEEFGQERRGTTARLWRKAWWARCRNPWKKSWLHATGLYF